MPQQHIERVARTRDVGVAVLLVASAVAHAHALADYVFEDAFITYRYARNLADGLGFVFNPGEAVLGTSAPLLTLLLVLGAWLGADVVAFGGALYCASLALAGALGALFLRRLGYANAGAIFAAAAALGIGEAYRYFGMETTLHLALILAAVLAAEADRATLTGVLLGLVCLDRYDGMVVAFVVGLYLWARRGRPPWREAVIASTLFGAWLLYAQLTFGAPTPNTLDAKAGDTGPVEYVAWTLARQAEKAFGPLRALGVPIHGARVVVGWIVLLAPCAWVGRRLATRRPALAMPLGCAVLLLLGYALIGPPKGHQWYHLPGLYTVVLVVLAAWAELTRDLLQRFGTDRWRLAPPTVALVAVMASALALPHVLDARVEAMVDGMASTKIGAYATFIDYIQEHDLEDTTLLTPEPGYMTYHTGQRAIDAAGLVTPGVYYHGPRERASSWNDLIDRYRPDLFVVSMLDATADPKALETHVPVATDAGLYWLFMSQDLLARRFDHFYEHWLAGVSTVLPERNAEARHATLLEGWQQRGRPMNSVAGRGFVSAGGFLIDFDELVFDFYATSERTQLQLLVDGMVVSTLDGNDSSEALRRRAMPVYPWRGRTGRLRVIDRDRKGRIHVGPPAARIYSASHVLDDFEDATFSPLWNRTWSDEPTSTATLARRFGVHFAQGRGVASSFGLEGERILQSRPVRVENDRWLMTVYDLGGAETGVHLWVDGRRVRSWGGRASRQMHMLVWDMRRYRGRDVVLQVRDGDPDPERGIAIDSLLAVRLGSAADGK